MRVLVAVRNVNKEISIAKILESNRFIVEVIGLNDDVHEYARSPAFHAMVMEVDQRNSLVVDIVRKIRNLRLSIPIMVLSENANGLDKARIINVGADDVLSVPFAPEEMIARLHAVIRRSAGTPDQIIRYGALSLNIRTQELRINEKPVRITGREFTILNLLLTRQGMLISKEVIIEHIYNGIDEASPKIVDVYICKLRHKIVSNGGDEIIKTVWGRGYRIDKLKSEAIVDMCAIAVNGRSLSSGGGRMAGTACM